MKLEKREITLNEKDSLKDVLYLEAFLRIKYADQRKEFRKETENVFERLKKETEEELDLIEKLYNRA